MTEIIRYIKALKGPILVTGASGFVGANLFKLIANHRDDVYAIVRQSKGWRIQDVNDENVIAVDINNYAATKNLINNIKPLTVFNCAAYGAYSFEEEIGLIYQTNFQSVINLVSDLMHSDFVAFINAGSSSEYGDNCEAPLEDDACIPNSHYAVSKNSLAEYLKYVGKKLSFPCVNLRLYSVYGELEDTSRLIPNLIKEAIKGGYPPFVNPKISRDFIYINDVCEAFIVAAVKVHPDIYGESFNIGTGMKVTIQNLAEVAKEVFGIKHNPEFGIMKDRLWDLPDWYSNSQKAEKLLGWKAKVSIEDGLRNTAQWISQLDANELVNKTKQNLIKPQRGITAVIACYKDNLAIPIMYQRLTDTFKKLGIEYEIIFVNDGSPDNSAEVICEISKYDSRVIGISHSRNFGSQMAFRSGMEYSNMDSVVLLDGDLQDPPELIEKFYEKWLEGWDVVYGRRVKRDMPVYLGFMYKLFYRTFAAFSYVKMPLDAGDFSLMDKRVVGWILNCPERDLFVRGLRAYVGFKQTGIDYNRPERMFGISTNNFFKNIEWAKKGIFSFSNTPLTMLTSSGIVLLTISIFLAFSMVIMRILFPDIAPRGYTSLFIVVLIFGSLNLFAIGLVGEYVAKITAEVKGRPRLIRSALIRNGETNELLPDGKLHL